MTGYGKHGSELPYSIKCGEFLE